MVALLKESFQQMKPSIEELDPYTDRAIREHSKATHIIARFVERWSRHNKQTVLLIRSCDGIRLIDVDGDRWSSFDIQESELGEICATLKQLSETRRLFNVGACMPRGALR